MYNVSPSMSIKPPPYLKRIALDSSSNETWMYTKPSHEFFSIEDKTYHTQNPITQHQEELPPITPHHHTHIRIPPHMQTNFKTLTTGKN